MRVRAGLFACACEFVCARLRSSAFVCVGSRALAAPLLSRARSLDGLIGRAPCLLVIAAIA
eukprot:2931722-Lingulodinium_polyedra.AAC.1